MYLANPDDAQKAKANLLSNASLGIQYVLAGDAVSVQPEDQGEEHYTDREQPAGGVYHAPSAGAAALSTRRLCRG